MRNGGINMGKSIYWIKRGIRCSLSIVIAIAIYTLFMSSISGAFTLDDAINAAMTYGLCMSTMLLFINNMSTNAFFSKLAISMGETRRNCHIGINTSNITYVLFNIIIFTALFIFKNNNDISLSKQLYLIFSIYLLAIGCGMCICCANKTINSKYNTLQVFLIIVSFFTVFIASIYPGILVKMGSQTFTTIINILILVLGIILCIVGNLLMRKKIITLSVQL